MFTGINAGWNDYPRRVKPIFSGKHNLQRDALLAVADVCSKEPKDVYCDLLRPSGDVQTYVIVERYKDVQASKEHGESKIIKKLGSALQNGLLDGPPDLQELVFIRSK